VIGKEHLKILLVDDDSMILEAIGLILESAGFARTTALGSGPEALDLLAREKFDLVLTDYDMPKIKGDKVARLALEKEARTAVLMVSGSLDPGLVKTLSSIGARGFIGKPFTAPFLIAEVEKVYDELVRELEARCHLESLTALAITAWEANSYRPAQKHNALDLALALGRQLGYSLRQLADLETAFLAQDIGMLRVDNDLLRKTSPLTEDELKCIRLHPAYSEEMVRQFPCESAQLESVRAHHERLDGTGYPLGLEGSAIPLMAQLLSLVDSYVAMDSDRPYRPALKKEAVLQVLHLSRSQSWNSDLVDLLSQHVSAGQ